MSKDGLMRISHSNTALAAFALAGSLAFGAPALAQSSNIGDEVVVDLSVLSGGGDIGAVVQAGRENLLAPPSMAPSSKLYIAPKTSVKLRQPSAKKKRPAVKTAAAKPKPKAMPAPINKQAAATVPKPPSVPPKQPAATPKPPAKPVAIAAKTMAAPPPPPPSPKPTVTAAASKPMPAAPKQVEQAAIPKEVDLKTGRALRLEFAGGESKLTAAAKSDLKLIGDKVRDNAKFRVQLLAFAGGKDLSPSKARRMSLARALSVRSQLIESGLRSTQIDVRALGDKTTEKPVNRVDVNFVER